MLGLVRSLVSESAWCRLNRLVLGKLLSKLGYEVMYGTNGIEAVQAFSQSMTANRDEQDGLFCILMVRLPSGGPGLRLDLYLLHSEDQCGKPRWYCMQEWLIST